MRLFSDNLKESKFGESSSIVATKKRAPSDMRTKAATRGCRSWALSFPTEIKEKKNKPE